MDPDFKRDQQCIARLASDNFATRRQATLDLEKRGEDAEPALHEALRGKPALDLHRRIETLLSKFPPGAMTPRRLRVVRALEALERMGTADAHAALETLADMGPTPAMREESQAARDRLGTLRGSRAK